jgi:anaerobic magnesium-protoporphyrin IX monomethyl ester cyclase
VGGLRVLLHRPPARVHTSPFPQKTVPLGLMSIAAQLQREGHTVRIVDAFEGYSVDDLVAAVSSWKADVVGITALTAHAYDAMVAAELIKAARPETLVVAGGIHFSAVPLETLTLCPHIDLVVLGEGEATFVELAAALVDGVGPDWTDGLNGVAGLAWLVDGALHTTPPRAPIPDLGWLARPAFELVDPSRYRMRPFRYGDRMMLEGSRGCPFSCSFCHTTQFWKRRWRPRPVEAILEDMAVVQATTGRTAFHFADDSWSTRSDRVVEFCEGVLSRGWTVDLWAQCRVDDLYRDRHLFPLMKRAGFYGMLVGFESGEAAKLERWKKGTTAEKARALAPALKQHFQSITGTFFLGDLDTVEADFYAARAFAEELDVDIFIQSLLTLFPPTIPLWREYEQAGIEMNWDYDAIGNCKVVFPTRTLSRVQVSALQGRSMGSFYADPRRALNALMSGKHAARSFTGFISSGLEDMGRTWLRSAVPVGLRGQTRLLRAMIKAKHLDYARERGMVAMEQPWTKLISV